MSFRPWATAGLAPVGQGADLPLDVVFVSRGRLDSWLDVVPDAPHRFVVGGAAGDVPPGYRDFVEAAGRHGAHLPGYGPVRATDAASPDGTTYRQWGSLAHEMADRLDLHAGDRLLVDVGRHEQPVMWLLAPLAAGASVVLCANLDPATLDARVAAEGVTRVL